MSTAPSQPVVPVEARLLLLLCRDPSGRAEMAGVAELCAEMGDWDFFLKLAQVHRVAPLVARNAEKLTVSPLCAGVAKELGAYAAANTVEAFRFLGELRRLLDLLAGVGIHATVLKGVPLSLQAFGEVATRDVGDIDLLIRPEESELADEVLQRSGFVRKDPAGKLTPRRRATYARHFKDYTYEPAMMQSQGGFEVDLHWRLFRNPEMPGNVLEEMDRECLSLGPMQVHTLPVSGHLLYLAVQGALDGWTRFKAVADIAALWNASDKAEVLAVARDAGVLPYLFAALLLSESWIGGLVLPADFDLEKSLQHPLTRRVVARAQERMQGYLPALRETSSWGMKRYEASLHGTFAYKWGIARRILFRPRVWSRFDLPDPLFPLYPLLSPVEWVLFHLQRGREKPS